MDKAQLKSVLDKYFAEVPDLTHMEKDTILNTKLHTLAKYGSHTITVSEIYNGNIAGGNNSQKAIAMFEDKAGDEDEATEGKVHIGDYVNYSPIVEGDTGSEAKYKYSSSNEHTGVTEAIAAHAITGFNDSSQDFTAKSNLKWVVIGKDGNNILITTETPIIPDNPVSMQISPDPYTTKTLTGYYLYGAKSYLNVSQNSGERNEINNIAQIYKYGKGADASKSRGMTIEDVNKITGVIADVSTLTPSGIYSAPTGYEYGTTLRDFQKGTNGGWTPETWIDTNIDKTNSANAPGINEKITGYNYYSSNTSLKTTNSTIRNKLIFGDSSNKKSYWLASRGVNAGPGGANFGPGSVYDNKVSSSNGTFDSHYGDYYGRSYGICPVLYLNSDVSLTPTGTENNITTWNID